jgi:hypothetical protein
MNERAIRATTQTPASLEERLRTPIEWHPSGDALEPWISQMGKTRWAIRLNDFPEEHLYTLLINGRTIGGFDDWPPEWAKVDSANFVSIPDELL